MKVLACLLAAVSMLVSVRALAGETYEGSYSASFADQMQSCSAAQTQAERVVRDHFRRQSAGGSAVSISDKRCDCSKNTRYATPLYECIGYATGTVEERAAFDDSNCVSILSSATGQATWGFRMSKYLSCVRQAPDYNRSWDAAAMDRVRQQQRAESD